MSTPIVHSETLEQVVSYLRDGTSVSLRGLPGAGRTSLIRRAADQLDQAGYKTIELRGNPALLDRPLEALAIADLVPANQNRTRSAVAAATEALTRLIEPRRTVVIVDDSDALDHASIGAISTVLAQHRVPLLSSASTARRAPDLSLAALVRPGVRVSLPPLSYDESAQVIEDVLRGSVDHATIALLHGRAGGLPGLVASLADNARRNGLLTQKRGMWTAGPDLWTPELARTVEPYVAGLSLAAYDALMKLALVAAVDIGVAHTLVGWEALEELDERGLLTFVSTAGTVTAGVYPPLVADHVRRERIGARRLRLVGEISESLGRSTDGSPWTISDEHRASQAGGEIDAVGADAESRRLAHAVLNRVLAEKRSAQVLVRRAEWEQHQDARSAVRYAQMLAVVGADIDEIDRILEPTTDGTPEDRANLTVWRALLAAFGRFDLREALGELTAGGDAQHQPLLDATAQHVRVFLDRIPEGIGQLGDGTGRASDAARLVRGEAFLALGRPAEALGELNQITDAGAVGRTARVATGLAMLLGGDIAGAEAWAGRAYEEGMSHSDAGLLVPHGYVLGLVHLLKGDEKGLREHLGPLLSVGITPLTYAQYEIGSLVLAARSAARGGRTGAARALADQAAASGLPVGPYPVMVAAQATAHARLAEGEAPEVVADELWAEFESLTEKRYVAAAVVAGMRAVEVAPDAARAHRVTEAAASADAGLLTSIADYVLGLVASSADAKLAAAEKLMKAGLAGYALQLQTLAARDLQQDDAERATDVLRAARRAAQRLGGEYVRITDPLPRRSVLTAREREVAELAAQGKSNQEVAQTLLLSVRTVENHLHRVFQKLRVTGRAALSEALKNAD